MEVSSWPLNFDYCSQKIRRTPPNLKGMRNSEAIRLGVAWIMEILEKSFLCRHEIQALNHVYLTIEHLEAKEESIPETNSCSVIKQITKIACEILAKTHLTSREIVNLYQLQDFIDQRLLIKKIFAQAMSQCVKTPEQLRSLARDLPFCTSEELFNQAVDVLIGEYGQVDEEIYVILNKRREFFQQIKKAKQQLQERKYSSPLSVPLYFDELLSRGKIDVYSHLLEMKTCDHSGERISKIEAMRFPDISRVILQTREAIIHTVESAINSNQNRNVLFLLGVTGAGKSTTLSFLRGDSMRKVKEDRYESCHQAEIIGHDEMESCTFLPIVEVNKDWIMVDYPGFSDTHGSLIALGAECALKWLIKTYQPKVLIIHPITDVEGKYKGVADIRSQLQRLLGDTMSACLLGITKYSHTKVFSELKAIKKEKEELIRKRDEALELNQQLELETEQLEKNNKGLIEENQKVQITFNDFLQNPIEISANPMVFQELSVKKGKIEIELAEQTSKLKETKERFSKSQRKLQKIDEKLKQLQENETKKIGNLESQEEKLMQAFGLKNKMQLYDLEDDSHRDHCLYALSELKEEVHLFFEPSLSASHRQLLASQLNKLLIEEAAKERYGQVKEPDDFISFQKSVLDSSLTNAVFSHAYPEIGQLLHLTEIDPTIVSDFDKIVVEMCINKCVELEVVKLNLDFLTVVKQNQWVNQEIRQKIQECEANLEKMIKYLVSIFTLDSQENKFQESWKKIQEKHKEAIDKGKKNQLQDPQNEKWGWLFPGFRTVEAFVKIGPREIKNYQESIKNVIADYSLQIEEGHERLIRLRELERLIDKQKEINAALKKHQLSLKSFDDLIQSVKNRTDQVKELYKEREWNNRIQFLSDKIRPGFSNLIHSLRAKETNRLVSKRNKSQPATYFTCFSHACIASLILCLNRNKRINFMQIRPSPVLKEKLLKYVDSDSSLLSCVNGEILFLMGTDLDPKQCIVNAIIHPILIEIKTHFSKTLPLALANIFTKLLEEGLAGKFNRKKREKCLISTGVWEMKERTALNKIIEQETIECQELRKFQEFFSKESCVKEFLEDIYYQKLDVEGNCETLSGTTTCDMDFAFINASRCFKYGFSNGSHDHSHSYIEGFHLWNSFFELAKETGIDPTTPLSEALLHEVLLTLWKEECPF